MSEQEKKGIDQDQKDVDLNDKQMDDQGDREHLSEVDKKGGASGGQGKLDKEQPQAQKQQPQQQQYQQGDKQAQGNTQEKPS
jgi:hypothetical protein